MGVQEEMRVWEEVQLDMEADTRDRSDESPSDSEPQLRADEPLGCSPRIFLRS